MRTYGRIMVDDGTGTGTLVKKWVVVQTDPQGNNDYVYITTFIQVLKLNLGESPFYGNYGIPAKQAVIQQVFPDLYVARTQQQFAQYFASLIVAKQPLPTPTYNISITTHQGVPLQLSVPE